MKCARCNRELSRPALVIGSQSIGPKCAELMGLMAKKRRAVKQSLTTQHDQQQELFDDNETHAGAVDV
jgi:hypothetical protein